jgi:hypothetical protein
MRPNVIMMTSTVLYPIVLVGAAMMLFARLGGLPPMAWRVLYTVVSQNNLQNYYGLWPLTSEREMLLAQAFCWLMAWSAFILTVSIAARHAFSMMKDRSEYRHQAIQRQKVSVEKRAAIRRATQDLIDEIDTLPVPPSRKMREYRQPERRTESVGVGCDKSDPYTLHSRARAALSSQGVMN